MVSLTWKPAGAVTVTGPVSEVAVTLKFMAIEVEFTCWLPKLREVGVAVMVGVPTVPVPVSLITGDELSVPAVFVVVAKKSRLVGPVVDGLKRK